MWKYLFAIVVSAAVIATSVYLYRHRDEMFRPDVQKLGGTRIVFAIEAGTPNDVYLTAMRRRFDPRGRLGVVVREGDGTEVEFLVPNGPTHDDTVARIGRIAVRPGKFAFVPTANFTADEGVSKYVQATYGAKKSMPRSTPPPTPINSLGEREFPHSIAGSAPRRYRWIRLGEFATVTVQLDPASLAGGNVAEKAFVEHAAKTGAILRPNAQTEAMILVARLPDTAHPTFFLLVRDESDENAITASHVRRSEVNNEGYGSNSILLRLDPDGIQRMNAIQHEQGWGRAPRPSPTTPIDRLLALVIDDQIVGFARIVIVQRAEALLEVGSSDEEREDLVCLLRGTLEGVRLKPGPTRVEAIEPRK